MMTSLRDGSAANVMQRIVRFRIFFKGFSGSDEMSRVIHVTLGIV
jgi:hypothetical protein